MVVLSGFPSWCAAAVSTWSDFIAVVAIICAVMAVASVTAWASLLVVLGVVGWGCVMAEVTAAPPVTGTSFEVGAWDSLVVRFSISSFSVFLG